MMDGTVTVEERIGTGESGWEPPLNINVVEEENKTLQGQPPTEKLVIIFASLLDNSSLPWDESEEKKIDDFLQTVYLLSETGNTRRAIDVVFETVNTLLNDGKLAFCDKILLRADVGRLTSTLMVAFLSITLAAKGRLLARHSFYLRVRAALVADRGEARASSLLNKYQ